ncbi:hypothetical protein JIX56_36505 [Streptomyces sp. CA-210063]|uniref:hypothetical protein n=1 Tax=Streptomyces sp. CA-210063 TaxID=2801029 RepID=UPI00214B4F78|nr:hypothetical protein [Streptomyces sp. CA-210063]UUU34923.1 hypothetical protein JIX56_36505 [Streptomyces sp. CA-210063]
MSARTHTRPHPATTSRVDIRLPWWAVALPALGFVTLLLLILNPAEARAASGDPMIAHLLERIQQALLNHAP